MKQFMNYSLPVTVSTEFADSCEIFVTEFAFFFYFSCMNICVCHFQFEVTVGYQVMTSQGHDYDLRVKAVTCQGHDLDLSRSYKPGGALSMTSLLTELFD